MNQWGRNSQATQLLKNPFELFPLLVDAIIGKDCGRSEMREHALAFNMRAGSECSREARYIRGIEPQAVHAGLELYVEFDPPAHPCRGALEDPQLLAPRNRG